MPPAKHLSDHGCNIKKDQKRVWFSYYSFFVVVALGRDWILRLSIESSKKKKINK